MAGLTKSQQGTVDRAREVLAGSHQMDVGKAAPVALCNMIGGLEVALEQVLRLVDELTGGA